MAKKPDFNLKKWYFDGVSADGRCLIGYAAHLRWRAIEIDYSGYLYLDKAGKNRSVNSFRQATEPVVTDQSIRWDQENLGLKGSWERASDPVQQELFRNEKGTVQWNCFLPAGACRFQLKGEPVIEGYGYVECLEMTLPPWDLGLTELRWGRFADPASPVVWINWKGAHARQWVFDGGQMVESAGVGDSAIDLGEHDRRLLLQTPAVVEDKEKIGEVVGVLASWIPGFERLTPLSFLRARGIKWRSHGVLQDPGRAEKNGWVIHELVEW